MIRAAKRGFALLATLVCASASVNDSSAADRALLNGAWQLQRPVVVPLRDARGAAPPLLPAGKTLYDQRRALAARGDRNFDLSLRCKPIGLPRVLWDGGPFDIQVQSDVILFGYTWNRNHRIVSVREGEPVLQVPRYYGNALAHWEGETLVVKSGLFVDNTLLDSAGLPHSEQMTLTERYAASADGQQLAVSVLITDPEYYRRSWTVMLNYRRVPGDRILEDVCQERSDFYRDLLRSH
jgi:hypothetical protein